MVMSVCQIRASKPHTVGQMTAMFARAPQNIHHTEGHKQVRTHPCVRATPHVHLAQSRTHSLVLDTTALGLSHTRIEHIACLEMKSKRNQASAAGQNSGDLIQEGTKEATQISRLRKERLHYVSTLMFRHQRRDVPGESVCVESTLAKQRVNHTLTARTHRHRHNAGTDTNTNTDNDADNDTHTHTHTHTHTQRTE